MFVTLIFVRRMRRDRISRMIAVRSPAIPDVVRANHKRLR